MKERQLLSTVTTIKQFCRRIVLEFNLTYEVDQIDSIRYGRVFVRNIIYNFSLVLINKYYYTYVEGESGDEEINIDEANSIFTGWIISQFPVLPQRLAAASLTSLYSVLHKTQYVTRRHSPTPLFWLDHRCWFYMQLEQGYLSILSNTCSTLYWHLLTEDWNLQGSNFHRSSTAFWRLKALSLILTKTS